MEIEGWLLPQEGELLEYLALKSKIHGDGVIVEIGSHYGKSTVCLAKGVRPQGRIYAIHLFANNFDKFWRNMIETGYHHYVVPIKGDSGNLALTWEQPIDMLFIDGDHSEHGVRRDLYWLRFVKPNGIVAFHDCTCSPDVSKAVADNIFMSRDWYDVDFEQTIVYARKAYPAIPWKDYPNNLYRLFLWRLYCIYSKLNLYKVIPKSLRRLFKK